MALTKVGNRVYGRIIDLSEESGLASGDKLIFHSTTTGNASIVDWSNVKVDLEHCTFGPQFSEILNFTSTAQAWVDTMTSSFNEINTRSNEVIELTGKLNDSIEAIKLLLKLMIGIANDKGTGEVNKLKNTLTEQAREVYESIINEVEDAQDCHDQIDFSTINFLQIAGL